MRPPSSAPAQTFRPLDIVVLAASLFILGTVAVPSFQAAQHGRKTETCLSNLRRIGVAVRQYAEDYDGAFPPAEANGQFLFVPGHALTPDTPFLLRPYLPDAGAFRCPEERALNIAEGNPVYVPQYAANQIGRATNQRVPDGGRTTGPLGRPQSAVAGNTLLLWEHNSPSAQCAVWDTAHDHFPALHNSGFNALFTDGHAATLKATEKTKPFLTYWED